MKKRDVIAWVGSQVPVIPDGPREDKGKLFAGLGVLVILIYWVEGIKRQN